MVLTMPALAAETRVPRTDVTTVPRTGLGAGNAADAEPKQLPS